MLIKTLLLVCLVGCSGRLLLGQALGTASRVGNLQIGGTFNGADPDYTSRIFSGFGFYSTFDFRFRYGVEAEFHQLNDPNSVQGTYERSYEVGPRYILHRGRLTPYAKIMIGRGVFNFPPALGDPTGEPSANLAYTLVAAGLGADYRLRPTLNLRVDCEVQQWIGFPSPGLTPRIVSIGLAYHVR